MLHVSGTGGAPTYGLVPQMPLTNINGVNLMNNMTYMQPGIQADTATVWYYKKSLQNGVVAEVSASQHAGILKYKYLEEGGRHLLIDLSHFLPSKGKREQWYSNGSWNEAKMKVSTPATAYGGKAWHEVRRSKLSHQL
jgi:putative alpha-1,2-mannosidase